MIETIGAEELVSMILCASAALNENRETINELNVFPVPDGDTGTNMSLTMSAAAGVMNSEQYDSISAAADAAANALLRGARGNSGVILSLLFRGIARSLRGCGRASAGEWAQAMNEGVEAAYKAVMKPAEGTILTVSRRAAEAAGDFAAHSIDVELTLERALAAAREALAETQDINPVLRKAGVVDAGGMGYVTILTAMLASLRGEFTARPAAAARTGADFAAVEDEEINFTYCTEFIVARECDRDPRLLRAWLENAGDSLVFVEDEDIIKVHVHTDEPGKAITEALRYGALQTVKVENMRNQHTELSGGAAPQRRKTVAAAEKPVGFVAVCAGAGLEKLFRSLGADQLVTGGQTMNPSTEDILDAVNRTPAETVFVFPNNKNIILAAEQCIPLCEKRIIVVPTRTVPQGIAALAYMTPGASPEELEAAFSESAGQVHTALVTYAARDSEFDGSHIRAGEYLALMDGTLLGSFVNEETLLRELNWALGELEPEIITVFYGADVTENDAGRVAAGLEACFADAEVSVVNGGQPVYYYMISVE